jgi:hypothetical protein
MPRKKKVEAEWPKYSYADSARYSIPAKVAGEELVRIRQVHGKATSAIVVDEARPEAAPLHAIFDWDDFSAAEKHRRHQAGSLIRAVIIQEAPDVREHRQYVLTRSPEEEQPTYQPAIEVVQDADLFADAAARLQRNIQQAQSGLRDLERLARAQGAEPERLARISFALQALTAAEHAIGQLQH